MNLLKVFSLLSFFISTMLLANIQVFPTRVILSDTKKVQTVSVRNKSNETLSYTIKTVFYRMEKDGSMTLVDNPTPEERPLVDHLRFSPRRVRLKPNQQQVIRIMLKKTAKLANGDYRAHIRVVPFSDITKKKKFIEKGKISMELKAQVAVAISVLYYKGAPKFKSKMENFTVERKKDKDSKKEFYEFSVDVNNLGDNFLAGDMQLYLSQKNKKDILITEIKGLASYLKSRKFKFRFPIEKMKNIKTGKYKLVFKGPEFFNYPIIGTIERSI